MPHRPRSRLRLRLAASAEELVGEFPELAPGSVIRCYARVVGQLRLAGEPDDRLPDTAQRRARSLLEERSGRGSGADLSRGELQQRAGTHDDAARSQERD